MNYEESGRRDIDAGQRTQEQIQFYFLTLAFTLLALAIETYKPGAPNIAAILEILSWLFLLISGLSGLYRLRTQPKIHKISLHINLTRWNIKEAREIASKGEKVVFVPDLNRPYDIAYYLSEHEEAIKFFENEIKKLDKNLAPFVLMHEIGLAIGIALLAVARAYDSVASLFCI